MVEIALTPKSFSCSACDSIVEAPEHCGRPMDLNHDTQIWMCWKGEHKPCCGKESVLNFDPCCDDPNLTAKNAYPSKNILL